MPGAILGASNAAHLSDLVLELVEPAACVLSASTVGLAQADAGQSSVSR